MNILIAGGGVGGSALAVGLCREGHDVTVLERDAEPDEGGAAVTIFSNGFAALAGLGVDGTDLGAAIERMRFVSDAGSTFARLDLTVMHRATSFPVRTVPRRVLVAALQDRLPAGTVRRGSAVTSVELDEDRVTVHDSAGATFTPDVLVGADGHRSVVRRAVVDTSPARSTRWTTWQGLDPVLPDLAAGTEGVCVVGPSGLVGLMPAGDGLLQWWFDVRDQDVSSFDDVRRTFAAYRPWVAELLDAVDDGRVSRFAHVVHRIPDEWGRGPTTLIGDAAHVFPPSQAQGANQALEDAWVLAGELRADRPVVAAVRGYERRRLAAVRRISALAASEITNRPPSRVMRLAGRLAPPAVAGRAWLRSVRSVSSVLAS